MGKNYGVLVSSGSAALLLALRSLQSKKLYNLPKKTKIITPIAGFPATINPIFQLDY